MDAHLGAFSRRFGGRSSPASISRETVAAVLVLALLGLVALPLAGGYRSRADKAATQQTLEEVRDALARYWRDSPRSLPRPHRADRTRKDHPQLTFLLVNPATWTESAASYTPEFSFDAVRKTGWRGPYLSRPIGVYRVDETAGFSRMYGQTGDKAVVDAWGRPVVLQYAARSPDGLVDLRVVSAGANGVIDLDRAAATEGLNEKSMGDDVYVALALPPET